MTPLNTKVLVVGIAFLLSVAWFLFWVFRLTRTARKQKASGAGTAKRPPEEGPWIEGPGS
jgi:hypothetical protein